VVGLAAEVLGGSWLGSRLRGEEEEEQLGGSCVAGGWNWVLELFDFCVGFLQAGNL
jgi:hypothetical protein